MILIGARQNVPFRVAASSTNLELTIGPCCNDWACPAAKSLRDAAMYSASLVISPYFTAEDLLLMGCLVSAARSRGASSERDRLRKRLGAA